MTYREFSSVDVRLIPTSCGWMLPEMTSQLETGLRVRTEFYE